VKSANPNASDLKQQKALFSSTELARIGIPEVIEHTRISWAFAFEQAAKDLLAEGKCFTSQDLVDIVGWPPGSHSQVGATMQAVTKRLKLRSHGMIRGHHSTSHGAKLELWGK